MLHNVSPYLARVYPIMYQQSVSKITRYAVGCSYPNCEGIPALLASLPLTQGQDHQNWDKVGTLICVSLSFWYDFH